MFDSRAFKNLSARQRPFKKQKAFLKEIAFLAPACAICAFLLAPFALFCFRLGSLAWPEPLSFARALFMTAFHAGASAFFSLFFALLASRGLIAMAKKKHYPLIEGLSLLPCFIPSLLLALSLVQLVDKIAPFPFGLPMLVFAQVLSCAGLCALALSRAILKEAPHLSEWARISGLSPRLFLMALAQTVLLKDIKTLFVLVFASCFAGLSLPLLIGGSPFLSLEFFIYEKLKDPALWPEALSLILFQSAFLFLICWRVFSQKAPSDIRRPYKEIYLLPKPSFIAIPLTAAFLSVAGLFFISDIGAFLKLLPLGPLILSSALNSLILSLGAGALVLAGLVLMSLSFAGAKARRFIASFAPPGASFMGFAFLLIPFYGPAAALIKWAAGLSLLIFPWIFRFRGERALDKLSSQAETARFLGAGGGLIFRAIVWPQCRSLFFLCAGMAGFWACGDFAYSLIVSSGHWSLSLLIYDLFSSYRLNEAVLLSWLLLFTAFFVFMIWMGIAFVFDRKLSFKQGGL